MCYDFSHGFPQILHGYMLE